MGFTERRVIGNSFRQVLQKWFCIMVSKEVAIYDYRCNRCDFDTGEWGQGLPWEWGTSRD
jgi:hypothetical protein